MSQVLDSDEDAGAGSDTVRTPLQQGRFSTARSRRFATEWPFLVALLLGLLIRLVTMLGFPPIMWYNDGFEYLGVALRFHAYLIRPDGYPALLRLLLPFHSFALVAALQHAMGLAIAIMLYALLRRWHVNRWLATAAVLVPLLDVHEVELEHLLLSDTLFNFLVVMSVTLLCWHRKVPTLLAALAGAALAAASLTRTVGVPLIIVGLIFLLLRWAGWRSVVAYLLLSITPLVAYAGWFDSEHHEFNLTSADGVFLYARVMAFANCAVIKPPPSLAPLCGSIPPSQRPPSQDYVWHTSPLDYFGPGGETALPEQRFTAARNNPALRFAIKAIEAQPVAYLSTGLRDFGRTFGWSRGPFPNAPEVATYQFSRHPYPILGDRVVVAGGTAIGDAQTYDPSPETRVVEPFAGFMIDYQRIATVRGPFIAALLVIGFLGTLLPRGRDDRRWPLLLIWIFAMALLLIPPFTIEFDYRYVVPAVPLAAASAALALAMLVPRWSDQPGEPGPERDGREEADWRPPGAHFAGASATRAFDLDS